jgi:hypothetical protein
MPMNAVADVSREPDAQDFEAIFRQLSPMVSHGAGADRPFRRSRRHRPGHFSQADRGRSQTFRCIPPAARFKYVLEYAPDDRLGYLGQFPPAGAAQMQIASDVNPLSISRRSG